MAAAAALTTSKESQMTALQDELAEEQSKTASLEASTAAQHVTIGGLRQELAKVDGNLTANEIALQSHVLEVDALKTSLATAAAAHARLEASQQGHQDTALGYQAELKDALESARVTLETSQHDAMLKLRAADAALQSAKDQASVAQKKTANITQKSITDRAAAAAKIAGLERANQENKHRLAKALTDMESSTASLGRCVALSYHAPGCHALVAVLLVSSQRHLRAWSLPRLRWAGDIYTCTL